MAGPRRWSHASGVLPRPLPSVYVVDPDPLERNRVAGALAGSVDKVATFERGGDFLKHPAVDEPSCILVALALSDMPVIDFIAAARGAAPVIVLGRVDDLSVAVELIRAGAVDVLDRPFDARRLRAAVRAAAKAGHPHGA